MEQKANHRVFGKGLDRSFVGIVAMLVMAGLGATNAHGEERWNLRLTGATATSLSGGADLGGDLGFGVGLEFRPTDLVGVELSAFDVDVDSEIDFEIGPFRSSVTSSIAVQPVLLGLNFHVVRSDRFGLHLGPVAGHVRLDDITTTVRTNLGDLEVLRVPLDDAFVFGGRLGFDLALGQGRTFLTGGATYLRVPLEVADGDADADAETGDLDALALQLGVGFRF